MVILGIDTSCDDTCIALLRIRNRKLEILSNVVSSQAKLHAKYGGVYPFLAKREHQKNLPTVLEKAIREAGSLISKSKFLISKPRSNPFGMLRGRQIPNVKIQTPKLDFIGVTIGPGLEPCLWQGVNFAKKLAEDLKLQIIPVNHIEAHILANTIHNQQLTINNFPAICLVVSGGHTQLILMEEIGKYKLIGETRDDAAGECFDKVARILGLGYPGGPVIAAQAETLNLKSLILNLRLPRPMIYQKNYDFSFSGLKTAVLYLVKQLTINNQQLTIRQKSEICHEVQQAIIDVLIRKTIKAAKDYRAKSIILGGGVAANDELRKQFQSTINNQQLTMKFFVPPKNLCTDNAAMIALTAYFHQKKTTLNWKKLKADANLKI